MGTIMQIGPAGAGPIEQTAHLLRQGVIGAVRAVDRVLLNCVKTLFTWQARARQRHQIAELCAHMRADMGLSNADVHKESAKPFWVG
jgi:uncharacterized protein YjiS (DUF1127 family)